MHIAQLTTFRNHAHCWQPSDILNGLHSWQNLDIMHSLHNSHLTAFRHHAQLPDVRHLEQFAQCTSDNLLDNVHNLFCAADSLQTSCTTERFRNLERLAHLTVFRHRSFTQLAQLTAFKYHAQLTASNIMYTQFVNCITKNISHHAQLTLSAVMHILYSWSISNILHAAAAFKRLTIQHPDPLVRGFGSVPKCHGSAALLACSTNQGALHFHIYRLYWKKRENDTSPHDRLRLRGAYYGDTIWKMIWKFSKYKYVKFCFKDTQIKHKLIYAGLCGWVSILVKPIHSKGAYGAQG
jgi:hypothetical protein